MEQGDFRGTGWRMPITPQIGGGLGYVSGDDNVAQSLWLMLKTATGERLMRPEFGTTVPDLVFEADSEQNMFRLRDAVLDAIRRWEPRVEVQPTDITTSAKGEGNVEVSVSYRVLRTNTRRNLVFPFYLASGGAVEL